MAARVDERAVVIERTERQGGAERDGDPAELHVGQSRQCQGVGVAVADDGDGRVDQRHEFGTQVALRPGGGARGHHSSPVRIDVAVEGHAHAGGGVVDGEDRCGEVLGRRDLGPVDAHHVAVDHGADPRTTAADVDDDAVPHRCTSGSPATILTTHS